MVGPATCARGLAGENALSCADFSKSHRASPQVFEAGLARTAGQTLQLLPPIGSPSLQKLQSVRNAYLDATVGLAL